MTRHTETRRLQWALAISSMYFFAELIAGFLTNSLALLSDAGHMLSDIGALSLSLFAFRMARRPATARPKSRKTTWSTRSSRIWARRSSRAPRRPGGCPPGGRDETTR